MRAILGGLCVIAGIGTPAAALTVEQAVNQYVAPLVANVSHPAGIAVGVYQGGTVTYFNFGVADANKTPVTQTTIFEIGSVTKTFTAALLAEAVRAGTIDLNASIVSKLPEGLTLQPSAQAITALELATYSSGLPDDPPNLPANIELRGVAHYTVADFFQFLSGWQAPATLPAPYLYSNTGVGLLGFLVSGSIDAWQQQVASAITQPLGMVDTAVQPAPNDPARHAEGFTAAGKPAPKWPLYAWAAAGALRSTASDMTRYVAANLGHAVDGNAPPAGLLTAMADARTSYYEIKPDNFQALTWHIRKTAGGGEIVFKDGGTAGFSTFVGYNVAKDLGVVILANWNGAKVVAAGIDTISHINQN